LSNGDVSGHGRNILPGVVVIFGEDAGASSLGSFFGTFRLRDFLRLGDFGFFLLVLDIHFIEGLCLFPAGVRLARGRVLLLVIVEDWIDWEGISGFFILGVPIIFF
jgi:hypothetical protein